MFQLDTHSAPLFRNKENNMLNKRIGLLALGVLSATQAMANDQADAKGRRQKLSATPDLSGTVLPYVLFRTQR